MIKKEEVKTKLDAMAYPCYIFSEGVKCMLKKNKAKNF